jgi:hypothetical protein
VAVRGNAARTHAWSSGQVRAERVCLRDCSRDRRAARAMLR